MSDADLPGEAVDASHPGVMRGEVTGGLLADRRAWDDSPEPTAPVSGVCAGDTVTIAGRPVGVQSRGVRRNYGQEGVCRLGLRAEAFGTVASLWVDRDPYLLDVCNGPVHVVDPAEVVKE